MLLVLARLTHSSPWRTCTNGRRSAQMPPNSASRGRASGRIIVIVVMVCVLATLSWLGWTRWQTHESERAAQALAEARVEPSEANFGS